MSCKCQGCGEQYKIDLIVPNKLWERIKPKDRPEGGGLLCGRCIMVALENILEHDCFLLVKEGEIKKRFHHIIHGAGLVVPRQIVGYALDDIFRKDAPQPDVEADTKQQCSLCHGTGKMPNYIDVEEFYAED